MEPRIEFLTTHQRKCGNHRQWPTDLKAWIVSDSLRPDVTVQEVADRYGVRTNYLSCRKLARKGKLVLTSPEDATQFATIVVNKQAADPVISERLDVIPAQFNVIVTHRPKYACRTCTDGVMQHQL